MTDAPFMEPGIYLNMPEADYLADPSIGGSSLKTMIYDAHEWWWDSPFNKRRKTTERTAATDFGTALHKILLEGIEAYEAAYGVMLDPLDYPDALRTVEELQKALRDAGEKVSGRKDALTARLLAVDPDAQIMAKLEADHADAIGEREAIPADWDESLRVAKRIADRDPVIASLFADGLPEVSVFWREEGVPCRARLDWLRISGTIDLKSYAGRIGKHRTDNIVRSVMDYRYDLQEAHYRAARKAMKGLPVHGGTADQMAYLADCIANDDADFSFVFAKTQGAPFIEHVRLDSFVIGPAQMDRANALQKWLKFYEAFGLDTPWLTPSQTRDLNAIDFPAYFGLQAA